MKLSAQKIVGILIAGIVIGFIIFGQDELAKLAGYISTAAPVGIIVACLLQLSKYFAQAFSYQYAFKSVGARFPAKNTIMLVFGTFFMNTVAPSLNLAGATLVVDEGRRRGIEAGRSTSAAVLMQMSVESGFFVIMTIGFIILAITGALSPEWLFFGLILAVLITSMGLLLSLGNSNPKLLLRILRRFSAIANFFLVKLKKPKLPAWEQGVVTSFGEAGRLIIKHPRTTAKVFLCSVGASACELSCFIAVGFAFGVFQLEALISGYVIATLFAMISITPQGVGVVEAAVSILFGTLGIDATLGLSVVLVYRGLVFWMPFLIGAVMLRGAGFLKKDKSNMANKNRDASSEKNQ